MHVVSTISVEPDASMDAVACSCAAVVKDCSKLNCSYNKGRISSEQANVQVHWGNNCKNSFKVEDREECDTYGKGGDDKEEKAGSDGDD